MALPSMQVNCCSVPERSVIGGCQAQSSEGHQGAVKFKASNVSASARVWSYNQLAEGRQHHAATSVCRVHLLNAVQGQVEEDFRRCGSQPSPRNKPVPEEAWAPRQDTTPCAPLCVRSGAVGNTALVLIHGTHRALAQLLPSKGFFLRTGPRRRLSPHNCLDLKAAVKGTVIL